MIQYKKKTYLVWAPISCFIIIFHLPNESIYINKKNGLINGLINGYFLFCISYCSVSFFHLLRAQVAPTSVASQVGGAGGVQGDDKTTSPYRKNYNLIYYILYIYVTESTSRRLGALLRSLNRTHM